MNTSKLNLKKQFVLWGTIILVLAQCYTLGFVYRNFTVANIVFYYLLVGSLVAIWGAKLQAGGLHHIIALLWGLVTWAVLGGGFVGVAVVALYIALYIMRTNTISPHRSNSHRRNRGSSTPVQKTGTLSCYGRFAFTCIPMPWLRYTLDLDRGILTRDCLFPGRLDKDSIKKDSWGKDDDLVLKQVFDWDFSTKLYRRLSGVSCFEFQSKKIGKSGDKRIHWHNLPIKMVAPLREKLIEIN